MISVRDTQLIVQGGVGDYLFEFKGFVSAIFLVTL